MHPTVPGHHTVLCHTWQVTKKESDVAWKRSICVHAPVLSVNYIQQTVLSVNYIQQTVLSVNYIHQLTDRTDVAYRYSLRAGEQLASFVQGLGLQTVLYSRDCYCPEEVLGRQSIVLLHLLLAQ